MTIPLPSGTARLGALRLPRSGGPMFRVLFLALYTLLAAEDWSAAFPMEGWGTGSVASLIVLGLAALSALVMYSGAWLRWYLVSDLGLAAATVAVVVGAGRHGAYLWPVLIMLENRAIFRGFFGNRRGLLSAVGSALTAAAISALMSPQAGGNWALSGAFALGAFLLSAVVVRIFAEMAAASDAVQEQRDQLIADVVRVAEDERSQIANNLHDGPIQVLTAAAWNLSRLQTLTGRDPAAALNLASTVQGSLEQVIGELRQTMVDLRPPILDERGLGEAIQAHVVRLNPSMGFSISADLPQRPEATIETVLFRVAQEALTNVAKHADARHVAVELHQADGQLVLEVADDGKGFNVERVERSHDAWRHFGLATMRERVQGLRGSLVVTSQPGLGTTVSARVPSCEPGAAVRR